MRRIGMMAIGLAFAMSATAPDAGAQRYYPSGYGGYGMAGWGGDPMAAYMTGLGSYARGRGVYEVDRARARSINVDTAIKWNKALRDRQKLLRQDQRREAVEEEPIPCIRRRGTPTSRGSSNSWCTTINSQSLDQSRGSAHWQTA